ETVGEKVFGARPRPRRAARLVQAIEVVAIDFSVEIVVDAVVADLGSRWQADGIVRRVDGARERGERIARSHVVALVALSTGRVGAVGVQGAAAAVAYPVVEVLSQARPPDGRATYLPKAVGIVAVGVPVVVVVDAVVADLGHRRNARRIVRRID